MVSRVTYRPFDEDDFEELAAIVQQEWHTDLPCAELNDLAAKYDLARLLAVSPFSQVALVDGVPRGIVLACPGGTRKTVSRRWHKISENYLRHMRELDPIAASEHWKSVRLFDSKNDSLLAKSWFAGSTEISLLAVSASARGMGLGSVLLDAATTYLAGRGDHRAFLYTDTDCSWRFYEHCGFKRAAAYRAKRDERKLLPKELYVYGIDLSA